jgi:hypothetical protein
MRQTTTLLSTLLITLKILEMMGLEYKVKVKGIVKLSEGNWPKWARDVGFSFMEAGLSG